MLAAAVPARPATTALELGAGAGTASLCLAARVPGIADYRGRDRSGAGRARQPTMRPPTAWTRGCVSSPPTSSPAAGPEARIRPCFCNPPFHGEGQASPDAARATRADGRRHSCADWLKLGCKRTVSGGYFTTILRADRLGEALAALPADGITRLSALAARGRAGQAGDPAGPQGFAARRSPCCRGWFCTTQTGAYTAGSRRRAAARRGACPAWGPAL